MMFRRIHHHGSVTLSRMEKQIYGTQEPEVDERMDALGYPYTHRLARRTRKLLFLTFAMLLFLASVFVLFRSSFTFSSSPSFRGTSSSSCNSVEAGYFCNLPFSHTWGQYSPFFAVNSKQSLQISADCQLNFVQLLSRHGARFPTYQKSQAYKALIVKIQTNVHAFLGKYRFLKTYEYGLGADDLIEFGRQEMVNSGTAFAERYNSLINGDVMFVRASGQDRVVESAQLFVKGFNDAQDLAYAARTPQRLDGEGELSTVNPADIVIIPEGPEYNNTLDHSRCSAAESSASKAAAASRPDTFLSSFVPPLQDRLNHDLLGANLSATEVIFLMDLCPFTTLAFFGASTISPFCNLFTNGEWGSYNHFQTLQKYYGYGPGAEFGPTLGVGWVNELIARLTSSPVKDRTNVNHTLDDDSRTFPLNRTLYADFSHDNDMVSIFSALGLWNSSAALDGFEARNVVPFAARAWIEKMSCDAEDYVRVIVNNQIMQLSGCETDELGRCPLNSFINSLAFAQDGGRWQECY